MGIDSVKFRAFYEQPVCKFYLAFGSKHFPRMNTTATLHTTALQKTLERWSRYLIFLLIGLGLAVLLGWQFDLEILKRPLPYQASMNPTTAMLFILCGFAFLCLAGTASKKIRSGGYLLSCLVFTAALLKLLDAFAGLHSDIDLFIFSEKLEKEGSGKFSNGMASVTAFAFLLASLGLPLVHVETAKKIMPAHFISLLIGLLGLLSVLGCIYQVQASYMSRAYIPMVIHTAAGFLLLALAILFADPGRGLMRELTGSLSGSQAARFLIPLAILIPMLLGYLRLLGHWSMAFSTEFGVAILILSIIIVFVLLIWFNSASLNKKDALRIEAETKLKANVQQLKESEEKFHKVFQANAAGITITRLVDSRFVEVNDAFVQMTGYSKAELINRSSVEVGMIISIEKREEILQQIKEEGWASQFEMTVRHKSGTILGVLASVETILLNDEKYAINIIFDITAPKQAEMQLAAVNKELEAFSYSISHDLRAPLRAVDGYAKMLEEDYNQLLNQEGKEFLNAIQYNAKKMSQLIDDLLDFSRLGRKTIRKANLDMNELVAGILIDLEKTNPHQATIKVAALHPVKGDYALMKQVLINLISNAIKYSSKKEGPVVELFSELSNEEVIFHVKDNGEGFDMKYANKLFGVFQRLHTDQEFEGTGVGLAIVQRIISKHGGRVRAQGEVGRGSTFSFTLPVHQN
jgi:PAS domain S-box-containing protein